MIAHIRTDFDAFSQTEAAVLENHGYTLAQAAIQRHLPQLAPSPLPPMSPPHPWIPEEKARLLLKDSDKRTLLGRF